MINTQPGHRHLAQVCHQYGFQPDQIRQWNKSRGTVEARSDLLFRLVIIERWSSPKAGRFIGRDHTTVIYSVRRFSAMVLGTHQKASLAQIRAAYFAQAMEQAA